MADPIGRILSAAREDCGLSIAGIAKVTRIPVASIMALEEGHFENLPAPVFVRGFIRSYCREVDLDPGEVLARYDSHLSQIAMEEPADNSGSLGPLLLGKTDIQPDGHRGLQISHVLLLLLALVTFIIAYVSAGTTPTTAANNAASGGAALNGDSAQTERAAGHETTVSR